MNFWFYFGVFNGCVFVIWSFFALYFLTEFITERILNYYESRN